MKWLSQRRKVEALSSQASLLSVQSHALKQQLRTETIEHLRSPAIMAWAFAAGVFWFASPATKRFGRVQKLMKLATTSSYIFKLLGIPLPMKSPF